MSNTETLAACRATLAAIRTGSRLLRNLSPEAVDILKREGLATEHTEGYLAAAPAAAGYCADPSSFEIA